MFRCFGLRCLGFRFRFRFSWFRVEGGLRGVEGSGAPKGGAPKGGAPKGGGPNPEKVRARGCGAPRVGPRRVGPRRVGGPKGGAPKGGGPQNFALFFPLPPQFFFFPPLSFGLFRGILVVFEAPGPSNVHVWSSRGVVCEPRRPGLVGPQGFHTTAREPKRAHLRSWSSKTTPKFNEKDQKRGRKE